MTNNLVATGMDDEKDRIQSITDVQTLIDMLDACLIATAKELLKAAWIWKRIKQLNGEYKTRKGLFQYLPMIADNKVLPELVITLMSNPKALARAVVLDAETQKRIADGEPVRVIQTNGDASLVPVHILKPNQVKQVFGRFGLNDDAEQANVLRQQLEEESAKAAKEPPVEVKINRDRGFIEVIGHAKITLDMLLRYAQELSPKKRT